MKAEKAFKQSLSLRVKKFGLDDLGVSSTLCALGDVYFHQKRYDDAFRSYKESLRIWKFHRGNDRRTAELYYNIGLVFYSKGPYAKAKLSVMECLRIRREICGSDSLPVASSLHLLGLTFIAIGDYEEAVAQLNEALTIRQTLLGKNSPNHLLIHNVHVAIGRVHSLMGDFEKAMKSFSTVLMGRTIRLGKHHPLVAEVLQTIGDAYIAANEYSKAAETLEEALRIRRSLLGPSTEVAETLNSLSLVYFCCDDFEHAIELSEQSLKTLKGAVSRDHFIVAKVLKNSGDYKQNMDLLDDAIEDYTESLRVMTAWLGRDHISLSELLNEIGVTYFKKEEFVLAKESFTEVRIVACQGYFIFLLN
jgi:tetratricopeptide (TPR) repeat protein